MSNNANPTVAGGKKIVREHWTCAILDERKLTNFRSLQGEAVKLEDM